MTEWNNRGTELYGKGDYEGAIECFNKIIEMDPTSYKAWFNKGKCYYKLGNYGKAVGCYDEALKYETDRKSVV